MEIYKGYQIKTAPQSPTLMCIVTDGKGGKIPDVLASLYTTATYAKQAIDKYLNSKPVKEVSDAKAVSKA